MMRYLVFGVIVTAILIGAKLWFDKSAIPLPGAAETAITAPVPPPVTPASNGGVNSEPVVTANITNSDNQASDETPSTDNNFIEPLNVGLAWTDGDPTLTPPDQYQRKGIQARALQLNLETISRLRPGDDFTVSIPQTGQNYTLAVDSVGTHQNGDRRVTGSFKNETLPYNIILTEGRTSTFATINTPDGSYMLEAIGNSGWITSLADLDYLSAPNQTDLRIPNIAP